MIKGQRIQEPLKPQESAVTPISTPTGEGEALQQELTELESRLEGVARATRILREKGMLSATTEQAVQLLKQHKQVEGE